jgi:hypothetical protein
MFNSSENKTKIESKRRHGQCHRSLDEELVDKAQSYRLLQFGDVKAETESTIGEPRGQALSTKCFKKKF